MSAAPTIPTPVSPTAKKELPANTDIGLAAESALDHWRPLWWLPCELALQIPIAQFTVGELLRLRPGGLISSGWSRSTEVPLYANGQRIGSSEFEAVDDHIAARITALV